MDNNTTMPASRYGWAFLLAWVFCLFYSGLMPGFGEGIDYEHTSLAVDMLVFCTPVCCAVLTLLVIVAYEERLAPYLHSPQTQIATSLAAAVSTPLFFVTPHDAALSVPVLALAGALAGTGSGFMWLVWTELFARLPQEEVERCAPRAAVVAACVSFAAMVPSGWASILIVAALPLVSAGSFLLAWRRLDASGPVAVLPEAPRSPAPTSVGRAGFGLFAACFFASLLDSFWDRSAFGEFQGALVLFLFAIVFMLAVSVTATAMPRRVTMPFLFRWTCPLMSFGFAAVIVLPGTLGPFVATGIVFAVRFTICLITQMYFALCAARGLATPIRACGLGWVCIHAGDLLGILASSAVWQMGQAEYATVCAMLIPALVAVFMFVLGNEEGLLGSPFAAGDAAAAAPEQLPTEAGQDAGEPEPAGASQDEAFEQRVAGLAREHGLTPRETEVFELLARGRSVPYIRDTLIISKNTAATHTKHVYQKLGVHSRQELIDYVSDC